MVPRATAALVVAVTLAGCAGGLGLADRPATTDRTTTELATTADRMLYPDPPDELTSESAKAVALDYEEAYVHNRLRMASELTYFSVREGYVMSVESEVLNESDGGVYVRVQMPYSTGTEDSTGDGGTNAVYFVSEETVERVRGDEVSP